MTRSDLALFYAVRWRFVSRYLGQFCLIIAALNIVTLAAAVMNSELTIAGSYLGIVIGLGLIGLLLSRAKADDRMQMNEALVLAAAVFLLVPLVAAIPLVVHGISLLDAWFETVSAATTTGLSTRPTVSDIPRTFLFARAWMQWYGGLGIVVLSLALVVRPGMTALRLASMETPDDLIGGTRAHARRVLLVYLTLTGIGLLGWLLLGGQPMEGILYILAAISTGGFAPSDNSLADLSGLRLAWVVTLVAFAGAAPLALYHKAIKKNWRKLLENYELRLLLFCGLFMSCLLGIFLWAQGMTWTETLIHAPLMALSAQTTSGFSSLDPASLGAGSKLVLIMAMAGGGCVGSTAGGFKLLRLLILLGLMYRCLLAMSMPSNAILGQRLGKKQIEPEETQDALMIILMFIAVVFISWLPFLAYGYAPLDALFEVVSATGTVGLSSGITHSGLPAFLKLVLCADMLLGRLEFVAWMVFFYHRTWFGRKRGIK